MPSGEGLRQFATFDPDLLKGKADDAHSVFFVDGKLLYDPVVGRAHINFFNQGTTKSALWLRQRLAKEIGEYSTEQFKGVPSNWFKLYDKYLFGRIGHVADQATGETVSLASFWGRGAQYDDPTAKGPADQIPACIQALYYKDLVDDDTVVVYGDGRVCTAGDLLGGQAPDSSRADPEAARKIELARRMHLATGAEKAAIMKQLGVGGGGSDKVQPWDRSLRDRGLLAPGQQHWRMHSESLRQFEKSLDEALGRIG